MRQGDVVAGAEYAYSPLAAQSPFIARVRTLAPPAKGRVAVVVVSARPYPRAAQELAPGTEMVVGTRMLHGGWDDWAGFIAARDLVASGDRWWCIDPQAAPGPADLEKFAMYATVHGAAAAAGSATTTAEQAAAVHTVKVVLRGSSPPIWRRLQVPSAATLEDLHEDIQLAFGWDGYHGWDFRTGIARYGDPRDEFCAQSADAVTLGQVAPALGARFLYTYDFGDCWEHDILVEDVAPAEPGVAYPRCAAGHRAAPPEDCGGLWGYEDLLEVLADPARAEHGERLDWLGLDSADQFDPAAFEVEQVNQHLGVRASVLVR